MNTLLIGCVGKPSAGKSTFLNAATDANAKVGNYPFTTIAPNHGVTFYVVPCPCAKYNRQKECLPQYGRCVNGSRWIPVKMLDVAGLVPGAHAGQGLGNQFLDDLRHADVLLHIVDVSGTTNEKGEATRGYDPLVDIEWLTAEIHLWILNNLLRRWESIVRRHIATKSSAVTTLQAQLSGYGSREGHVVRTLTALGLHDPVPLEAWDESALRRFTAAFVRVRFPTILVLNKIDSADADRNIERICQRHSSEDVVLTSALSECFLRRLEKQGQVRYTPGDELVQTHEQDATLPELDAKTGERISKLQDLVLLRYGGTGIHQAVRRAVERAGHVPVYPVRSVHSFVSADGGGAFRDCYLVPTGTTIRQFARLLSPELERCFAYAENPQGRRLSGDEPLTADNNIIRIVTDSDAAPEPCSSSKPS